MKLQLMGKDPESGDHGSPTVWVDGDTHELVIQGWSADEATLDACRRDGPIPGHESVIRIPPRMVPLVREALGVAELD
ncbi:hypothetical protein ACIBUY_03920 [Streptomyces sp. NPDC050085]|uniref:hypothetical protein n=1 Tax=Streptomyces sp. NPDC050085 TaxID=3365600 RepID=UPI0037AE2213